MVDENKQRAFQIVMEVFGSDDQDSSRMNDAEKLLTHWSEAALDPGQLRTINEVVENHMCGEGDHPSTAQVLLEQLAGRADELLGSEDVYCLAEEVLDEARSARVDAEEAGNGTYMFPGIERRLDDELLLDTAHVASAKAHLCYATFARFLHGSSTYVDTMVELANNGREIDDLDLMGIRKLCEELKEVEESLRAAFARKADTCKRRETRTADVLAAIDVVGVERVATRIASHYGLGAQAMVLAEECCELGHAATRVARVAGAEKLPDDVRAELLEEAADVILMIGQLTWLVGIDPKDVECVMREKVARTIVLDDIPFKADEECGS